MIKHHPLLIVTLICFTTTSVSAQILERQSPESQGVSSKGVLAFVQALEQEVDSPHGFVLLRHGHVIAQGWWAPYQRKSPHMLYSLSKSFTSTAIGLLADEGKIDIDDSVLSFFPDDGPPQPSDHLKAMRVRDLLSMTTGHDQDTLAKLTLGKDKNWARTFLAQPVEHQPGTYFCYNTGATYMLSVIVQKTTGKTLLDFLTARLFKPLGIEKPTWETDPKDINVGGWGLNITTEDIAKFGQLYLQRGKWDGKRLLSDSWIHLATSTQTANGSNKNSDWNQGYGFQFWRCRHNAYRGDGAFGQFCVVMPDQEMVLAITAGQGNMQKTLDLVWQHLLPAVQGTTIPPDKKVHESLVKRLDSLSHPLVKGEASSSIATKVSGHTFTLEANNAGLKSVVFDLKGNDSYVMLNSEHGQQKIAIDFGKWRNSVVPFRNLGIPAAATTGTQPIAASAAWSSSNQLQIRVWLHETPFRLELGFTFGAKGRSLVMTTRMHPLQGKATAIKGVAAPQSH